MSPGQIAETKGAFQGAFCFLAETLFFAELLNLGRIQAHGYGRRGMQTLPCGRVCVRCRPVKDPTSFLFFIHPLLWPGKQPVRGHAKHYAPKSRTQAKQRHP